MAGLQFFSSSLLPTESGKLHVEIRRSILLSHNQTKRVAVFVQGYGLNDSSIRDDIFKCIKNVGDAKTMIENFNSYPWVDVQPPELFEFDIFISHVSDVDFSAIKSWLAITGPRKTYGHLIKKNKGMDIKQFLDQLQEVETMGSQYNYFLKIHTKSQAWWRRPMLESLCGTPAAVLTVLRAFGDKKAGIIAPQGFLYQRFRDSKTLYGPFRSYLANPEVAMESDLEKMILIYRKMFAKDLNPDEDFVFSAGTMFWSQYRDFAVKEWLSMLPWMSNRWAEVYRHDGLLEHAIERLFLSIPYLHNVTVAEIGPAVKPIAIYFPQYHNIPENDALHGEGFTEWTLLKPSTMKGIAKPLAAEHGGLGYYDLTEISVRRKQGEMAKAAGIHGFMYYHYWFSGKAAINYNNPVMGKVPQLMLEDGHPDIPFMMCWANEPWTNTWDGLDTMEVKLPQNYGKKKEWKKHFYYLLQFFKHQNYILVDEKPVFVIYRIGHMKKLAGPMIQLWRKLALLNGLKGLYIVYSLNGFLKVDNLLRKKNPSNFCDASNHFFPTLKAVFPIDTSCTQFDVPMPDNKNQYWGGFTTFNNNLRRATGGTNLTVTPSEFKTDLGESFKKMLTALPSTEKQANIPNFFFINAWNEWNEQAILEPSDKYGFSYLSALKDNLERQPIQNVTKKILM